MLAKYYWTGKKLFLVSVCVFVVDESSAKANLALLESDIFFFSLHVHGLLYMLLWIRIRLIAARAWEVPIV